MARLGPDAARYVLAGSGTAVPRPFHLRWLLPALCGDDIEAWRFVWLISWPVAAAGFVWWQYDNMPQALAGCVFLLALPGILGPEVSIPVQVDLPATAVGLLACGAFGANPWHIAACCILATFAGCIRETAPIMVALWVWSPWPLVGLVAPLAAYLVRKPGPCPIGLPDISDHPLRSSLKFHTGQWRDAWIMVAPWGVCLAALYSPSWQVGAVLAVAYGQLLMATDSVRLYQHAAGPVLAASAAAVIPPAWLPLAVAVHVVWWRTPHRI